MPTREDTGFDALLKPLQNLMNQVWEITLTKYLEEYLEYIRIMNDPTTSVNFTEAALLVHNSASFYCKRVDSLHAGYKKFVEKLDNTDKDVHLDENGIPIKRKRNTKSLESESLEDMDFVFSEGNVDLKTGVYKNMKLKTVILNKNIRTETKTSTSVVILQRKGDEMGRKDEFRLNWPVSSEGDLNEDFCYFNSQNKNLIWDLPLDDGSFYLGDVDAIRELTEHQTPNFDESMEDEPMDNVASPPHQPVDSSPLPGPSSPKISDKRRKGKVFTEINFDFHIPLILMTRRKNFRLPLSIINDCLNWKERRRLKSQTVVDCCNKIINNMNVLRHEDRFLLNPKFKISLEGVKTQAEFLKLRNARVESLKTALLNPEEEFHGFDLEDNDDNNNCDDFCGGQSPCSPAVENNEEEIENRDGNLRIVNVDAIHVPISNNQEEIPRTYEQDAAIKMQEYHEQKRKYAKALDDVTKRVAAWHEQLHDVLDASEARSHYDVHEYGTKIIESFPEDNEDSNCYLNFTDIIRGQPREEISRFFLSSLMLANTYNVELSHSIPGDLVKDCLQIKLLSRLRHHEEMDENFENIHQF